MYFLSEKVIQLSVVHKKIVKILYCEAKNHHRNFAKTTCEKIYIYSETENDIVFFDCFFFSYDITPLLSSVLMTPLWYLNLVDSYQNSKANASR